jgi:hypothetical protein
VPVAVAVDVGCLDDAIAEGVGRIELVAISIEQLVLGVR